MQRAKPVLSALFVAGLLLSVPLIATDARADASRDGARQTAVARLSARAAERGQPLDLRWDRAGRTARYIRLGTPAPPPGPVAAPGRAQRALRTQATQGARLAAQAFVEDNRTLLGLSRADDAMRRGRERTDRSGRSRIRFDQALGGHPVWGRGGIVHLDETHRPYLYTGNTLDTRGVPVRLAQNLTPEQALEQARAHLGATSADLSPPHIETVIFGAQPGGNGRLALAYKIHLADTLTSNWLYFIDAGDGALLHRIDQLRHASVAGSGTDLNGQSWSFEVWEDTGTSYLLDETFPDAAQGVSGDPIVTEPMQWASFVLDAQNVEFDGGGLFSAQWVNSNAPDNWDATAVSALINARATYEYFRDRLDMESYDDAGGSIKSVIHVGVNYVNAFFYPMPPGEVHIFGYGDGDVTNYHPMSKALDVVAHEYTHAIDFENVNLIYEFQSGALSESFSDCFAAFAEHHYINTYGNPGSLQPWSIGEDLTVSGEPDRSMAWPPDGNPPQPAHLSDYQIMSASQDNGGVHINSGIPNHACYQIVQELGGDDAAFVDAEQVYHRALTGNYLLPGAQFIDARRALIDAAADMTGWGAVRIAAMQQAVAKAFDAVGVFETVPPDYAHRYTDIAPNSGTDWMAFLDVGTFTLHLRDFAGLSTSAQLNTATPRLTRSGVSVDPATGDFLIYYVADTGDIRLITYVPTTQAATDAAFITGQGVTALAVSPGNATLAWTDASPLVHVLDLTTSTDPADALTFTAQAPPATAGDANVVRQIDSLAFDFTGRALAYGALTCYDSASNPCDNFVDVEHYTVAIADLAASTTTPQFVFPQPADDPGVQYRNPVFAANNNYTLALDRINAIGVTEVIELALDTGVETLHAYPDLNSQGGGPYWGAPSFFGDDGSVAIQAVTLGNPYALYEADQLAITPLVGPITRFPLVFGGDPRPVTASVTADQATLDFGTLDQWGQSNLPLTLCNEDNSGIPSSRAVNIIDVPALSATEFVHSGVAIRLAPGVCTTFDVGFRGTAVTGGFNATLNIVTDADNPLLSIPLSASVQTDGGTGPGDPGDGDGGNDFGSYDDDGFFIGPCFLDALSGAGLQ